MKSQVLLLLSVSLVLDCAGALERRPVRMFHGLGSECKKEDDDDDDDIKNGYKCVETGSGADSFTRSIKDQAIIGCKK